MGRVRSALTCFVAPCSTGDRKRESTGIARSLIVGSIMKSRRETRRIRVGGVPVGEGAPVSVQSMTNTDTRDVRATVAQIRSLAREGCEIARVAIPVSYTHLRAHE